MWTKLLTQLLKWAVKNPDDAIEVGKKAADAIKKARK